MQIRSKARRKVLWGTVIVAWLGVCVAIGTLLPTDIVAQVTKRLIGKEDVYGWDGATSTFSALTSTGRTMTLNKLDWMGVDVDRVYGGKTSTSFQAALTAIGTSNLVTLWFAPGTWTLTSSVTVPANITLSVPPGASFSIGTGLTLTINGGLEAGRYTIFSGAGSVAGTPHINTIYPEWWGAIRYATFNTAAAGTDSVTAISSAISSFTSPEDSLRQLPWVSLDSGIYRMSSTLTIAKDRFSIRGQGPYTTFLISTATSGHAISITGQYGTLEGFSVQGTAARWTGADDTADGIHWDPTGTTTVYVRAKDLKVEGHYGDGIDLCGVEKSSFDSVDASYNGQAGWRLTGSTANVFDSLFTNCRAAWNGTFGWYMDTCKNLTFIDLQAVSNGYSYTEISFTDNEAVHAASYKTGDVDPPTDQQVYLTSCANITFQQPNITLASPNCTTPLTVLYSTGIYAIDSQNCTILGGSISYMLHGIYIQNQGRWFIRDPTIHDGTLAAACLASAGSVTAIELDNSGYNHIAYSGSAAIGIADQLDADADSCAQPNVIYMDDNPCLAAALGDRTFYSRTMATEGMVEDWLEVTLTHDGGTDPTYTPVCFEDQFLNVLLVNPVASDDFEIANPSTEIHGTVLTLRLYNNSVYENTVTFGTDYRLTEIAPSNILTLAPYEIFILRFVRYATPYNRLELVSMENPRNTYGAAAGIYHRMYILSSAAQATLTWTAAIPAGSLLLGTTTRVTELFQGGTLTSIDIGYSDPGPGAADADNLGNDTALALGTTTSVASYSTDMAYPIYCTAATDIILQSVGGNFSAAGNGKMKIDVYYWKPTAPTS